MTQARTYRGRGLVAPVTRISMRSRLLGLAVLAVGAVMVYLIVVSINGVPFQPKHRLVVELPPGTPPVNITDQVRVAGQRVGFVSDTDVVDGTAELELEIAPEYWPLGDQTTARIRVRPGAGLRFVDLTPAGSADMSDGAVIPVARVSSGTTLTEVAETFDPKTRGALSGTLVAGGYALTGQGDRLNRMLDVLPTALRQGTPLIDALTPEPGTLSGLLNDGAATARAAGESGRLPELLSGTADTAGAVAARRDDLADAIDKGAPVMDRLDALGPRLNTYLEHVDALVAEATPTAQALERELPTIRRLLAAGATLEAAAKALGPPATDALEGGPAGANALRGPVQLIPIITPAAKQILTTLLPYSSEIQAGADALYEVTSKSYPGGVMANRPAARVMLQITCMTKRNTAPKPGEAVQDRGEKGRC